MTCWPPTTNRRRSEQQARAEAEHPHPAYLLFTIEKAKDSSEEGFIIDAREDSTEGFMR
jgi:hypothetical protein